MNRCGNFKSFWFHFSTLALFFILSEALFNILFYVMTKKSDEVRSDSEVIEEAKKLNLVEREEH